MKYDICNLPDGRATARPSRNGTTGLNQMLRAMTLSTTLTRADGLAAATFITEYMAHHLARGITVNIDGFGTFGVSLRIDGKGGDERITGNDVQLKRVTFRASPSFRQAVANAMRHERVDKTSRYAYKEHHTVEERREIALCLAATKPDFTVEDYRQATSLSLNVSRLDLRRFEGEGVIRSRRIGRTKLYSAAASDAAQGG